MTYCNRATYKNNIMEQYLYCNVTNSPCAYQKYCHPKQCVIHTETVANCPKFEQGAENE